MFFILRKGKKTDCYGGKDASLSSGVEMDVRDGRVRWGGSRARGLGK